MNIMLAAVQERTREIGLRKALGAKNNQITKQFLVETIFITLVGGVIGIVIGILIAMNAKTQFGKLLATGITVFITIQTLINLASQAILIPLTGVPLPFISYGGSSMLINFAAIGLLLNIALNKSAAPRKHSSLSKMKKGTFSRFGKK
jgi:ABC-type antimicrobial peptide transport system permease subunit